MPISLLENIVNMQQDQPQTTSNEQEKENGNVPAEGTATQLVPQQGEIKNNDHDPAAGSTSPSNEAKTA